ncbi:Hypothetical predicted protein, partial [Marmota monax]
VWLGSGGLWESVVLSPEPSSFQSPPHCGVGLRKRALGLPVSPGGPADRLERQPLPPRKAEALGGDLPPCLGTDRGGTLRPAGSQSFSSEVHTVGFLLGKKLLRGALGSLCDSLAETGHRLRPVVSSAAATTEEWRRHHPVFSQP